MDFKKIIIYYIFSRIIQLSFDKKMRKGKGGEGIEEKKKKPMRVTFPFFFRMGVFLSMICKCLILDKVR